MAYASLPPLAAGRRQARFIASKYGMARSDVPDNPNLRYTAELVPPAPLLSAGLSGMRDSVMNTVKGSMAPTEAPISPDAQAAVAPPNPSLTQDVQDTEEAPDNVLPFIPIPEMTDAQQGSAPPPDNEWEASHQARLQEVHGQLQRVNEIGAHIMAAANGEVPPLQGPAAGPVVPPASSTPKAKPFTGFSGPVMLGGQRSPAWQSKDPVGFNDAAVEQQNPGWTGGTGKIGSWTPHSSMDKAYATAGIAVGDNRARGGNTASERFYQRTYDRAVGGSKGDIVRFNRFSTRNQQRDAN